MKKNIFYIYENKLVDFTKFIKLFNFLIYYNIKFIQKLFFFFMKTNLELN